MIIAHHLILTGYGHWLPNDPRGSMSERVHTEGVAELGEHHYGRRKEQPSREELRGFHRRAEEELAHAVLWWDNAERQALVEAFGEAIVGEKLTCYACAVLSNHVHLLIRKHRLNADQLIGLLKDAGRSAIQGKRLSPDGHPVFSADSCHVFKSDPQSVRVCVHYIERNYAKHHLAPPMPCDFVVPYDNWPFHKNMREP